MIGKKRLIAVALMLVVLAVPLLVQPVFADDAYPDCFVQILKYTEPVILDQDFHFTYDHDGTGSFDLGYDDEWVFDTGPHVGAILVSEVVPEGWQEPEIECSVYEGDAKIKYLTAQVEVDWGDACAQVACAFFNEEIPPAEAPPFVPEASTLILLASGATTMAGYVGLQIRARRRR